MKKFLVCSFFLLLLVISCLAQTYKDPNATVQARVSDLMSRMTLDEKIGQMTQAELTYATTSETASYRLGSLLNGGGAHPGSGNNAADWANMYDSYQNAAVNTGLGIPIIWGVDAVHGFGNVYGSTVFPHNIGLGATRDAALLEQIGTITAREVAATGLDWTFAPCLAVPRDERWGRTYEGFGEDPEIHDLLTASYIRGFQGANMDGGERIVATAKHWIADGGTQEGQDQGNAVITEQELRNIHMRPYLKAIEAGVGTVMISYSSWNGTKCHGHKWLITDLLKNELGFKGFVISDYNGVDQINTDYTTSVRTAVNAGIDMFMAPKNWKTFISTLKTLVNNGEVAMSRINDAVQRILTVKFRMKLFEQPLTNRTLLNSNVFGSATHRDKAREAVRKSLVLLKNNNNVLPLAKNNNKIFVAGKAADNIGIQCGGWTISWQGASGNITIGTTILQGIRNTVGSSTTVNYNQNGSGAAGNNVAIVVVGETPYAEGQGYKSNIVLDQTDISCINNVKAAGIPMVVVLVSGRPMIITDQLNDWSALVAAWLPGSEGRGVAEVLFGDYAFTGKLPHSWPRTMSQIPINKGASGYDPLFAYGYGLSYNNTTPTPTPTQAVTRGDVNSDGKVDIVDALMTAQYYVGLNPLNFNAGAADVNNDAKIDIVDALMIAQAYVGLIRL